MTIGTFRQKVQLLKHIVYLDSAINKEDPVDAGYLLCLTSPDNALKHIRDN
jgi:hypothetical protein